MLNIIGYLYKIFFCLQRYLLTCARKELRSLNIINRQLRDWHFADADISLIFCGYNFTQKISRRTDYQVFHTGIYILVMCRSIGIGKFFFFWYRYRWQIEVGYRYWYKYCYRVKVSVSISVFCGIGIGVGWKWGIGIGQNIGIGPSLVYI